MAHTGISPIGAKGAFNLLLVQPWQEQRPPVLLRGLTIDTGTYQYGDPSPAEQAHLERINRVHLDLQAEAVTSTRASPTRPCRYLSPPASPR